MAIPVTPSVKPGPTLPYGLGQFANQFNQGYSLSYSGGDKDRLMGQDAYTSQDFPDFMQRGAPVGQLNKLYGNLGSYFDFNPIQQSAENLQGQQMNAAKMAAGSAARAATNRAMLSGGQVGADFARASALQPFFRQQAAQNLDLSQLRAQMGQGQAQLSSQLAAQIAGMKQQTRGMRQNYAVDAARLAQKNIGIGGSVGYGTGGRSDLEDQLLRARIAQMAPPEVKPGYLTNAAGLLPGSVGGQQMFNRVLTGDTLDTRLH